MGDLKFSVFEGLYYMAPTATFWLAVISLLTEDVADACAQICDNSRLPISTSRI